jgi:serine/threonine-protein kinase
VGGSYVLKEVIGVGGMGRVYRAEQSVLGRTVAVKVIHPHLLGDEQTVARFYNEARTASRLNHPNSVGIIDFGRTDDGTLYLAMEHIAGKDLAVVMHEEGPLPLGRICDVLIGVLDALGEAHALGVIHRDLKPENIILRRFRSGSDLVKVVDFGLATIAGGPGETSITRPGLVCGTPDYMSPEQGRGEAVDGRGDLYSLGVVLFELLTEHLPFEADSPTKVVLRHIYDPLPDPRELAPYRDIPLEMVEIVQRALAKDAAERFQAADEFQTALRGLGHRLTRSHPPGAVAATCGTCGAENPSGMRFCGSCGARLAPAVTIPPHLRRSMASLTPVARERPLVGRDQELAFFDGVRDEASGRSVWVHVRGEAGVGKTRLLGEVSDRFAERGDVVAWATPHPSGAPVPYAALRSVLAVLFGVDEGELCRLVDAEGALEDPLTLAGMKAVLEPVTSTEPKAQPISSSASAALATALRGAMDRSGASRGVLVIDDIERLDGLSRSVFEELPNYISDVSAVIVTSSLSAAPSAEARLIELEGLDPEIARRIGENDPRANSIPAPAGRTKLLPLYVEQAAALGGARDEHLPARLGDVVAQRMEQLDLAARRVLQAAAVLGYRANLDALRSVTESEELEGLDVLRQRELVRLAGADVEIVHPLIRDLVAASVPAEARRELHARALHWVSSVSAPLEVRAEHAYRAGEPMGALMLLERMGDLASARGDSRTAVLAFRRGLELARRELLESGELVMDRAIVTFSRKLGEAMERQGDVMGADGVLRETMDLTGPSTRERALMLLALGRVARRRQRPRDALRLLHQALEIARGSADAGVQARVHLEIARIRRAEGDVEAAVEGYRVALDTLDESAGSQSVAETLFELGETLLEAGETEDAVARLEAVAGLAPDLRSPVVAAKAVGSLGTIEEMGGNLERAVERYEEAARLSARAGDAEGHGRWRRAAAALPG